MNIQVILFDLGGVLVEVENLPELVTGSSDSDSQEKFWRAWMNSEAVKVFEGGEIGFSEFVGRFLDEHQLSISPATFIKKFKRLPKRVYEGAEEILRQLQSQYQLAVFSNNNEIHWKLIMNGMGLGKYFPKSYSSHLIGKVKPDIEAFQWVANDLGVPPAKILFLDDNIQNVESARAVGMHSERVKGVMAIESTLKQYIIFPSQ